MKLNHHKIQTLQNKTKKSLLEIKKSCQLELKLMVSKWKEDTVMHTFFFFRWAKEKNWVIYLFTLKILMFL